MHLARVDAGIPPVPRPLRDLFVTHVDRVYAILRLRGVPEGKRDDMVHDVFVRVVERWHLCKTQRAPEKWIDEITRNVEREQRRASRREAEVFDLAGDAEDVEVAEVDTNAERHDAARLDLVRRLLHEIPNPDWREVVSRRIEGQAPASIAAALDLPLGTVATWFRRGKHELLAALARHDARERQETRKLATVIPLFGATSTPFDGVLDDVKAPESLKARVWERLADLPAHGGGGGGGPPAMTAPGVPPAAPLAPLTVAAPISWAGGFFGVAIALLLVGIGVALALLWDPLGRRSTHGSHVAPIEPRPDAVAAAVATPALPGPSPDPSPSSPAAASSAPSLLRAPAPAPADTLAAEHEILDPAERALRAHHPREALLALAEHARRFPLGRLADWRERMRAEATALAGETTPLR